MSNTVFTGASTNPDSGSLKNEIGEYNGLQNIRGWGGFIAKRRGIQSSVELSSGILGIFDLYNDGDPLSPNKILVVDTNGDFVLYDYSELITIFDYLFSNGIKLGLQSPDLNWWSVIPNDSGELVATVISTPISTISSDLQVTQDQLFGFQMSSNVYRLSVDPTLGELKITSYNTTSGTIDYTQSQNFVTGVGPVFQTSDLNHFRLTINNSGELVLTVL